MAKKTGTDRRSSSPPPTAEGQLAIDGRSFLRAFPRYIRTDVSTVHFSDEEPHRFLEFLRDNSELGLKHLCSAIVEEHPELQLTLWPTLFVLSEAESKTSAELGQSRGSFLVGVQGSSDADSPEGIRRHISDFQEQVEDSDQYADMRVAPSMSVVIVDKSKLGELKVDNIMWSQHDSSPMIFPSPYPEDDSAPVRLGASFLTYGPSSSPPATEEPRSRPKLRPAQDVIDRLKWDPSKDSQDYSVIYLDRFTGFEEVPLDMWTRESTDDEFVPQHRITAFKQLSTGEVIWHRELRIDKIFGPDTA
jgi:uncharacterized protein (UPF0248 family)